MITIITGIITNISKSTVQTFSFPCGGRHLIEVDDSTTQSLHGGCEGTTGTSAGLVEHGGQYFALVNPYVW